MNQRLRIAVTSGEPAGIGPDILLMLANQATWPRQVDIIVLGDKEVLARRAQQLGLSIRLRAYQPQHAMPITHQEPTLFVEHIPCPSTVSAGYLNMANAPYVLQLLDRAILGCQQQEFAAMVTAPIHKGVINDAGIPFTGHTEYLAQQTQAPLPVMMLATNTLRVALATTHMPLKEVAQAIQYASLRQVLQILAHDLQTQFAIQHPRILVCGLNPHAGEGGHLGREEIETIIPVIRDLQQQGLHLTGPLPADTLFTPSYLNEADAVLAMYHDQGLPVLKYAGFGQAVNITLGLPLIRTSVDHGTALDLAGKGSANTGSLLAAIQTAIDMSHVAKQMKKGTQP